MSGNVGYVHKFHRRRPRLLTNLQIDSVDSVDKGAAIGARVLITKRYPMAAMMAAERERTSDMTSVQVTELLRKAFEGGRESAMIETPHDIVKRYRDTIAKADGADAGAFQKALDTLAWKFHGGDHIAATNSAAGQLLTKASVEKHHRQLAEHSRLGDGDVYLKAVNKAMPDVDESASGDDSDDGSIGRNTSGNGSLQLRAKAQQEISGALDTLASDLMASDPKAYPTKDHAMRYLSGHHPAGKALFNLAGRLATGTL